MRYPKQHKQQTRERILKSAGTVFRRHGYVGGGVDAVMQEAGLTHGGFYAHFKSKEALFAAVVETTLSEAEERLERSLEGLPDEAWLEAWADRYLSREHLAAVGDGCPVPPLISELGRAGEAPRAMFASQIAAWRDRIADRVSGSDDERRLRALAAIAQAVGAMALARALGDDALASGVLEAARAAVKRTLLEGAVA